MFCIMLFIIKNLLWLVASLSYGPDLSTPAEPDLLAEGCSVETQGLVTCSLHYWWSLLVGLVAVSMASLLFLTCNITKNLKILKYWFWAFMKKWQILPVHCHISHFIIIFYIISLFFEK